MQKLTHYTEPMTKNRCFRFSPAKAIMTKAIFQLFYLFALLVLLCASTVDAAVYSVQGICRFTPSWETNPDITDYPFTISVSNCNWYMQITDVKSNLTVGYCDISYDGKYTYFLLYQDAWAQTARNKQGTGEQQNVAVGIIAPHEVPHFEFAPESGSIWLAYASSCYFAGVDTPNLEPAATLGVGPHGNNHASFLKQKAFWNVGKLPIGVPQIVTYLDDGVMKSNNGQITKWPEPLNTGFTNTTSQVLDYTNLGPLNLPLRAIMNTFCPTLNNDSGGLTAKLVLFYNYEVKATNITAQLLYNGDFKPKIPGVTLIDDWRFTTLKKNLGFNYYNRVGRWLEDSEVKKLPEYLLALAPTSFQPPPVAVSKNSRWVFLTILAALAILPLWTLLRREKK